MGWPAALARRYRLILVGWGIAALLLASQAQGFDGHLIYSFDPFIPASLEAKKAQDMAHALFNQSSPDAEFVVISGPEGFVATQEALQLLRELGRSIAQEPALKGLISVNSLASVFDRINATYWERLNATLAQLRPGLLANLTRLHDELFGLLQRLAQLHSALFSLAKAANSSSDVIYGLPSLYLQAWYQAVQKVNQSSPGQPLPVGLINWLALTAVNSSLPGQNRNITYPFLYAFYSAWNSSFTGPFIQPQDLLPSNALLRAQAAIDRTVPLLFNATVLGMAAEPFLVAWRAMNITQWQGSVNRFALVLRASVDELARSQGLDRALLLQLAALGQEPSQEALQDMAVSLLSQRSGADPGLLRKVVALGPQPAPGALEGLATELLEGVRSGLLVKFPPPRYPSSIPSSIFSQLSDKGNATTYILVTFQGNLSRESSFSNVQALRSLVHARTSSSAGLKLYVTGGYSFSYDVSALHSSDVQNIDRVTVLVVFALLAALLASLVAPLLPLALIGSALLMSLGVLALLAQVGFKLFYFVRSTISVVTLGAGIDYVIYMLFRYLEERENGAPTQEAIQKTTRYAGETVVTSALAVAIGFGSLATSRVGLLQSLGLSLALGVLLALSAALLLVPSLLYLLRDAILWPRRTLPSFSYRLQLFRAAANVAIKHRRKVIAAGLIATALLGLLALSMSRTYNDLDMVPALESKRGFELILAGFGAQPLSPAYVVLSTHAALFSSGTVNSSVYQALDDVCSAIASTPGVRADSVRCPTRPQGKYVTPDALRYNESSPYIGRDGTSYLFRLSLESFYSSEQAFSTIRQLRQNLASGLRAEPVLAGATAYVGGPAAFYLDLSTAINEDYARAIIPAAFIGIFIVLLLLLRSAVIPLLFLVTTVMSTIWTLGLLVAVFQLLLHVDIYWLTPIILFTVLIGLGMDYNVFLITRVREGVLQGLADEEAAAKAVERTALVLTGAGLIMAAAFGSLLVSADYVLKETGFALSVGILFDTFLVRLFMSPAIIASAKRWNWWPSALSRAGPSRDT
ncbi:MAG: hypothetical protein C4339_03895 [Nitrososphaerota archaeon]